MNTYEIILIGVVVLVVIIIICIFSNAAKKKRLNDEKPVSILDVDLNGVPSSSDMSFDYGYEKEDTIILEKINEGTKEKKKPVKKTTTKKSSTKKTTTKKEEKK